METKSTETITLAPSIPHVELVVTNSEGDVLCVMSGENPSLASLLNVACKAPGFPVEKKDSLMALGQDCYEVTREFVLAVRGTFTWASWEQILQMDTLPSGAKYTLVVTV